MDCSTSKEAGCHPRIIFFILVQENVTPFFGSSAACTPEVWFHTSCKHCFLFWEAFGDINQVQLYRSDTIFKYNLVHVSHFAYDFITNPKPHNNAVCSVEFYYITRQRPTSTQLHNTPRSCQETDCIYDCHCCCINELGFHLLKCCFYICPPSELLHTLVLVKLYIPYIFKLGITSVKLVKPVQDEGIYVIALTACTNLLFD